jgi:hypothetical protein
MSDSPAPEHVRPANVNDATVAAVGKLSEALETAERARGHLYSFHQLTGSADQQLQDAVALLEDAGHADVAEELRTDLVGRNVLHGRWTFQLLEDYDDGYWSRFRAAEQAARDSLVGGRRHLYEAEMKERERTRGRPGHEASAATSGSEERQRAGKRATP